MATDIRGIGNNPAFAPTGEGFRALPSTMSNPPAGSLESSDEASPMALETAVEVLAARAAQASAELDFRVDEDSGRVIVSVVDRRDGTVLRQMPSEEALRIARTLARYEPRLIEVRA